jgi:hypothetical protein
MRPANPPLKPKDGLNGPPSPFHAQIVGMVAHVRILSPLGIFCACLTQTPANKPAFELKTTTTLRSI